MATCWASVRDAQLYAPSGAGCVTPPPTVYHQYPPLAASAPVAIYSTAADIHGRHEIIGSIKVIDWGKWQVLRMDDSLPRLKERARSMGADAIIIDDYHQGASGIFSRGYSVEARAVRLSGS